MRAIRVHAPGPSSALSWDELADPTPGPGEVIVRVEAAGVNFIDTYLRTGLYKVGLPFLPGMEAAGVVTAVGEGVSGFHLGDRVATTHAIGAYAAETLVPADKAMAIPAGLDTRTAAALLSQGLPAHFLATDTFPLKAGDSALVHAAAGGVGLLLTQIAKMRGARVLATVGSDAKAVLAREAGADAVCVYTRENFSEAARRFTDGRGVDVAYDSVGKQTFEGTLDSLRPRGLFVSYGNASGPVPAFAPLVLAQKGSLYLTRPTLNHYIRTTEELRARVADLFAWVAAGQLKVRIGATFPLTSAGEAHRALEGRSTTGKVLLIP